jgi:acetoin utilization protein AcuC
MKGARRMSANGKVLVLKGENIAAYGFGADHPFGPDRHDVFHAALAASGLDVALATAGDATREELESFHSPRYLDFVAEACAAGTGFLDGGDTPAQPGLDLAATAVVGATLFAVDSVMAGRAARAFVPIAGLHHAGRDHASGFCVFNDCGVALELLRARYGLQRIAYVDIDAHHGDGVFYAFEADPDVIIVDAHEDGRFLFPGTGHARETGRGAAAGTKLNLPLPPGAGDAEFLAAWERAEAFLDAAAPEFIVLQSGADSIAGDPITHLRLSAKAHGQVAARLSRLAARHCRGRLIATGGGGYNRDNLARGWTAVVAALVETA